MTVSEEQSTTPTRKTNAIGVYNGDLGAIKPHHLTNNKPLAITVLSYIKSQESDNRQLKTENETLKTYGTNFEITKERSQTISFVNIFATILIGLGTNFLTGDSKTLVAGWCLLLSGIALSIFANIYLVFFKK